MSRLEDTLLHTLNKLSKKGNRTTIQNTDGTARGAAASSRYNVTDRDEIHLSIE